MWQIVALIISILIFIALIRIFFIKTIFDKLIILDIVNTLVIALLIVFSIIWKQAIFVDVAVAYAILSFIGVLYFTRYIKPKV